MKLTWLLFVFMCALAAARVPRMRRAKPTVETTTQTVRICAPTTPCAWSIYRPIVKMIEINLTNTYCVCAHDKSCQVYEDDTSAYTFIYRCMMPEPETETEAETESQS